MKIGVIYCIENKINGKKYIGATKRNVKVRISEHKSDSKNPNKNFNLYKDVREYGWENFEIYEIEEVSNSNLDNREEYHIRKNNTFKEGYNMNKGGKFKINREVFYGDDLAKDVIYLLNNSTLTRNEIKDKLGVNKDFITNIYNGKTYTHLWDVDKDNKRKIKENNEGIRKGYRIPQKKIDILIGMFMDNKYTTKTVYVIGKFEYGMDVDYEYVKGLSRRLKEGIRSKGFGGNNYINTPPIDYQKLKLVGVAIDMVDKGVTINKASNLTGLSQSTIQEMRKSSMKKYKEYLKWYNERGKDVGIRKNDTLEGMSDEEIYETYDIGSIIMEYGINDKRVLEYVLKRKKIEEE